MKLTVSHTLAFPLASPSRAVEHLLLTPAATPQQRVERWSIEVPGFADAATFRDGFGNRANLVSQAKPGETLLVAVSGTVETTDKAGVIGRLEYDPPPAMFLRPTILTPADETLVVDIPTAGGRIAMLHELMDRLHETTTRRQSQTSQGQEQSTATNEPLAVTHAFIAAARALHIPARHVSGYLFEDGGSASVHAWAEAYDDGLGWIGFDALLNVCPTEQHIRLASGLDATSTMPLRMVPTPTDAPMETVEIVAA